MKQILKRIAKNIIPQKILRYRFEKAVSNFSPYIIKKHLGETEFDFLIGDIVGKDWYDTNSVGNTYEMCFIRDMMITPGDIVFECGSHHGFTTTLLAKWAGEEGKVFAFEASKHNYDILQKNIEINKLSNVSVYNNAVGDTRGKINISVGYNVNVVKKRNSDSIEMVPLDEFKQTIPNLVKIDVEGFEIAVLKGAHEILQTKPKLVIEVHTDLLSNYGSSVEEIFDLIDASSYDIWIQWSPEKKPQLYKGEKISHRVHLFCLPKT
jgi:FkbM family methyltransferase